MEFKKEIMKLKNILKLKIILILFYSASISISAVKDFGTDIINIISDARIGFGIGYEYVSTGSEYPSREEINFSELNKNSLLLYHGIYTAYEKYTYHISARPVSRLSLKWNYEEKTPYVSIDSENSLLKYYDEKKSELNVEYFISPRWSLFGIVLNQVENNTLKSLLFESSLLLDKENKIYHLSKTHINSITLGSKITFDWGHFKLYNTILGVYNYLPELQGIPKDLTTLSYTNLGDNFLKKENTYGVEYYLNPAVKLDISGSFQNTTSIGNELDDTLTTETVVNYPLEVKYRLTEVWELGVKLENKHFGFYSETKNKTFSNEIEVQEIRKENYHNNFSYILLSLSRYFKYQGLNLYGNFRRYTEDKIYEYQETILYGEEKSVLWSRWDESDKRYYLEFGFYYRPIMEKLYVSAGILYEFPITYRKPLPAEQTNSLYNYSFSAFYKPTSLFEIKVEKGYRNLVNDYKVPEEFASQMTQKRIWEIERLSFSQLEEKESIGVTLRTLRFIISANIIQTSLGQTYYKRENVLLSERFVQPWAYFDVYQKYITYLFNYTYITQALFSQSQFSLNGMVYYKPDYSYDNGRGEKVNVSEMGYMLSVKYEFTPTFYIEGGVEEFHFFERRKNLGLEKVNSILANEDLHSYRQVYKINLVYRP